jgi:hypothetical protein
MKEKKIESGDCLSSLAFENGFFWETLWNENSEMHQPERTPFHLIRNELVRIPDRRPGNFDAKVDRKYRFRRRGVPAKLEVRLVDYRGRPKAGRAYTIEGDGFSRPGTTDDDGWIKERIRPDLREVMVRLKPADGEDDFEYRFEVGDLEPVTQLRGVQQRLRNLGYFGGVCDGSQTEELKAAVRDFQAALGWADPSGSIDDNTRQALRDAHAS